MRTSPLLAVLLLSAGLSAQVINIDFNSAEDSYAFAGLAAVADPAGEASFWNPLGGTGSIAAEGLLDSFGNVTSVGIRLSFQTGYLGMEGEQEFGGAGGIYRDLMGDYIYLVSGGDSQVASRSGSIHGLESGKMYDVYFYGQGDHFARDFAPGQNAVFTIGEATRQTSWDGVAGGDGLLAEGVEYVRFTVPSDESGRILFSFANVVSGPGGNVGVDLDGSSSRFAVINGIQIVDAVTVVPEPSTTLTAVIGLLALLRRRR